MTTLFVRDLGLQPYTEVWQAMQEFTSTRKADTADELWCLQHHPVLTLGQAGKIEHVLNPGAIPVIQVDRGGQVTYHGPGQLVCYLLIDLRRRGLGPRQLVTQIEEALIRLLALYKVNAANRADAPGVYVDGAKVASLGLRIRRGCSFHGLSLNVDMDLSPFNTINPCGYAGLAVTQLKHFVPDIQLDVVKKQLIDILQQQLAYAVLLPLDKHLPYDN